MAVDQKTKKIATDALDTASSIAVSSWQPLLVIGVVGLAIYFGKSFIDQITGKGTKETKFEKPKIDPQLPPATINANKAKQIAIDLFTEMRDIFPNDENILNIFRGNNLNDNDFVLVYNAFGIKKYYDLHGQYNPLLGTPSDLFIWLQKELDKPEQRAELKRLFPNTF
tara:strand:- start:8906 stop:9409 length:504 start_codon:yes stop_codon:yes gene_type:complete